MTGIDLSQYVRVTNTHEHDIQSRFDGEDYVFKPNEPEDIHVSAAQHMFGFGLKDKTAAMARLGLIRVSNELPDAERFLKGIRFEPVPEIPRTVAGPSIGPSEAAGPPGASGGGEAPASGSPGAGDEPRGRKRA